MDPSIPGILFHRYWSTSFPMRITFLLCLLVVLASAGESSAQEAPPHNMFLQRVVPADGEAVAYNAPVLRWPRSKGADVRYDVQLSRDSLFKAPGDEIITQRSGAFYNPHQRLEEGRWFWRHRTGGGKWSATHYFQITQEAMPLVSPPDVIFLQNIPASHPRILLDSGSQKTRIPLSHPSAQAILKDAEKALEMGVITDRDMNLVIREGRTAQDKKLQQDAIVSMGNRLDDMISALCQANLIRKDGRYARKAIAQALEVASWDHKGVSGSRDFTDGICMYDMALVFDCFYEELTPEQRSVLIAAIALRAEDFYGEWVNNIESKVLSGHVWQLILNEFFKTSLALYRHHSDAAKWLSYAYELFLARTPILGGADGGWSEGAHYLTMNMDMLVDIPEKIRAYTGFDFIKSHPWYRNMGDWLITNIPPGSVNNGFGDNSEELSEPLPSYAAFANVMAGLTGEASFVWYLRQLQAYSEPDLSMEPILRWYCLVNQDRLRLPEIPVGYLPPAAHVAMATGLVAMHTAPEDVKKNVMVAFRSSPFGAYGHILADQNTFNIAAGGKRLFYRTGYKVAMDDPHRLGWSKHTKSQNGVLINGNGQPYTVESFGRILRFHEDKGMTYALGDASNAYRSKESDEDHGMVKFFRHIALLQPSIIVIYDELESQSPASWSWLIHSIEGMELDSSSGTFASTADGFRGTGRLWSAAPVRWQITNRFEVPAVSFRVSEGLRKFSFNDDQWHAKAISTDSVRTIRFLSVIQVGPKGEKVVFRERQAAPGLVRLHIGDWEIEASLATHLPPQLRLEALKGDVRFRAYESSEKRALR